MTMWCVKYACSGEIFEFECEELRSGYACGVGQHKHLFLAIGLHAFSYKADAIKVAQELRRNKIASLQRQIGRIEKLMENDA